MSVTAEATAVLFVDIAGSTALRAALGDAEADRQITELLQGLSRIVAAHGGTVLKSDGDDLMVLFPARASSAGDAAEAAIAGQREARRRGLALYAGLSLGPVRSIDVLGRADVSGLSVNLAARLHKLLPNEPGFIFVDEATVAALPGPLQARCRSFGTRSVKGIGGVDVFSIDWDDRRTVAVTRLALPAGAAARQLLSVRIGAQRRSFVPHLAGDASPAPAEAVTRERARTRTEELRGTQAVLAAVAIDLPDARVGNLVSVGRSSKCEIVIDSPIVSGRHIEFFWERDTWSVRDLGRNGTWARLASSSAVFQLQGRVVPLGSTGLLCLGQPFDQDARGETTLEFSQRPVH